MNKIQDNTFSDKKQNKNVMNIEVIKMTPEMITSYDGLKPRITGNNGKARPECQKTYNFFKNLETHLEQKYGSNIDPVSYLYHLYYEQELITTEIYDKLANLGGYDAKSKSTIKDIFKNILNWPIKKEIERKSVGDRMVHQLAAERAKTQGIVYNVLKEDYKYLSSLGIKKPSEINEDDFGALSEDARKVVIRYKNLVLNRIFLKINKISFEKSDIAMESGVSNGKKELVNKFNLTLISKDIISYPLNQIYIYINENINVLKGDNKKQIELAKKFNIRNLGIIYRIVKGLGLLEDLGWTLVNMPAKKFELLAANLNSNKYIPGVNYGEVFFSAGLKLGINNPQHLQTGLSALGYSTNKIILTNSNNVLILKKYIEKKYKDEGTTKVFSMEDIQNIINEMVNVLPKKENEQIKAVTSVLRFFGYKNTPLLNHKVDIEINKNEIMINA